MNKKLRLILITLVAFILLAACNNDEEDQTAEEDLPDAGDLADFDDLDQLEPDLEGIPDIVAEVNGEEITRDMFELTYISQFQQAAQQAQMSGQALDQDLNKQELAESMIDLELLVQEAERRNFAATDQEIEEYLVQIAEANQLESVEMLFEAYEEQGMSEEELREEIATQIKLNQLIEDEAQDITISEDQVEELYEELLVMYEEMAEVEEEELPSMEELRPDLEDQILYNEENQLIIALIEHLKNDAEIVNHM